MRFALKLIGAIVSTIVAVIGLLITLITLSLMWGLCTAVAILLAIIHVRNLFSKRRREAKKSSGGGSNIVGVITQGVLFLILLGFLAVVSLAGVFIYQAIDIRWSDSSEKEEVVDVDPPSENRGIKIYNNATFHPNNHPWELRFSAPSTVKLISDKGEEITVITKGDDACILSPKGDTLAQGDVMSRNYTFKPGVVSIHATVLSEPPVTAWFEREGEE